MSKKIAICLIGGLLCVFSLTTVVHTEEFAVHGSVLVSDGVIFNASIGASYAWIMVNDVESIITALTSPFYAHFAGARVKKSKILRDKDDEKIVYLKIKAYDHNKKEQVEPFYLEMNLTIKRGLPCLFIQQRLVNPANKPQKVALSNYTDGSLQYYAVTEEIKKTPAKSIDLGRRNWIWYTHERGKEGIGIIFLKPHGFGFGIGRQIGGINGTAVKGSPLEHKYILTATRTPKEVEEIYDKVKEIGFGPFITESEVEAEVKKDDFLNAKLVEVSEPYTQVKLDKEALRLEIEKGKLEGNNNLILQLDDAVVVKLGMYSRVSFDIEVSKPSYYQVNLRYGDLANKDEFPRLQCMLDTQIIGLAEKDHPASGSYTSFKESVSTEKLGTILIQPGKHTLWLKACYTPVETVDYLELIPLKKRVEKPILTFVHIADPHVNYSTGPRGKLLAKTLEDINKYISPDVVVHGGDFRGGYDQSEKEVARFKENKNLIDAHLDCPWYAVQGNHDLKDNDEGFLRAFELEKLSYSFDVKGIHFIVLAIDWKGGGAYGPVTEEDLAWLDKDLAEHKGMKTFIFCHANVVSFPFDPRLPARNRISSTCSNARAVLEILDKYPNIIGGFYGHLHTNNLLVRKGVFHVITASLCWHYPLSYRAIRVYPDHLEMRSYQVSNEEYIQRAFIYDELYMGITLNTPQLQEAVKNNDRKVIINSGQVGLNCELNYDLYW